MKRRKLVVATVLGLVACAFAVSMALGWDPGIWLRSYDTSSVEHVGSFRAYRPLFQGSQIVFDMRSVRGDARRVDVIHALANVARGFSGEEYARVVLASRGEHRFWLDRSAVDAIAAGAHPIAVPALVHRMDDTVPWPERGVLAGARNLNEFLDEWLEGVPTDN